MDYRLEQIASESERQLLLFERNYSGNLYLKICRDIVSTFRENVRSGEVDIHFFEDLEIDGYQPLISIYMPNPVLKMFRKRDLIPPYDWMNDKIGKRGFGPPTIENFISEMIPAEQIERINSPHIYCPKKRDMLCLALISYREIISKYSQNKSLSALHRIFQCLEDDADLEPKGLIDEGGSDLFGISIYYETYTGALDFLGQDDFY